LEPPLEFSELANAAEIPAKVKDNARIVENKAFMH